jgi:hypothetical protein
MRITIAQMNQRKPHGSMLTIIERMPDRRDVLCKCDCGVIKIFRYGNFASGNSTSCGCNHVLKVKEALSDTIENLNNKKPEDSRLTAIHFLEPYISPKGSLSKSVLAKCSCGNYIRVRSQLLKSGKTKSCGCYNADCVRERASHHPRQIRTCYRNMIKRCYDPKSERYDAYGAKGVIVCDEWLNSYESFLKWALNNGWNRDLQIDKDILGSGFLYSPNTCCFVTRQMNGVHKKTRAWRIYNWKGDNLPLKTICDMENFNYTNISYRIKTMGLTLEEAIKYKKY